MRTKLIALGSIIITLSGCSYTGNIVGKFENNDEILVGTATGNALYGSGILHLKGETSSLTCEGIAEAPYFVPAGMSCKGQRGRGFGTCSDGRTFKYDWIADSCNRSDSSGKDSIGNLFKMIFDMNPAISLEDLKNDIKKESPAMR